MRDSKLIEILRCFNPEEMKSFEKFVNSAYFSTGRDLSGLYILLKKSYPLFDQESLSKENLHKCLFPGQQYNDKRLKNHTSELTRLAERFLTIKAIETDEPESAKLLTTEYRKRNNEKLFLRTINLFEKKVQGKPFDSHECYRDEEEIEKSWNEFYITHNDFAGAVSHMAKYSEYFTLGFLVRFLRRLRDKIIVSYSYNIDCSNALLDKLYECIDFEKLISKLEGENYDKLWLIKIYYYALLSAADINEDSYYAKFKELFRTNMDKFSHAERHHMFADMINYCHMKESFLNSSREEFELYKEMIETDSYCDNETDFMSLVIYRNIMIIANNQKEYEWLDKFIDKYTCRLKPEYRNNMMSLAKAHIHYSKREYESALRQISKVQYDYFIYKMDVKNMMLKIYYELGLFDQALFLIDTYRHYLNSTEDLNEYYKEAYSNFLNFYNKLLKSKMAGNLSESNLIMRDIEAVETIHSRKWLLSKANELAEIKKGAN